MVWIMKRLLLLMIAVMALVGCGDGDGSKETGGGKIARNVTNCVDCEGIVAPSAVSCPHCGSTDFTGSKRKEEEEADRKRKEAEWARIVANTPPPPTVPKLDIRLTQKGYKTNPENFQVVCKSAAMTIARYYPKRQFKPILIPKANNGYPVKLNESGPKGESQIMLSVGDGWAWDAIAFEFAHEFTHILINEKMPGSAPNHWINEAFCEAASYHALKQMAKEWAAHPPYPNWKDYAKYLNINADRYLGKERARPEGMEFSAWFRKNEKALRLGKWFCL